MASTLEKLIASNVQTNTLIMQSERLKATPLNEQEKPDQNNVNRSNDYQSSNNVNQYNLQSSNLEPDTYNEDTYGRRVIHNTNGPEVTIHNTNNSSGPQGFRGVIRKRAKSYFLTGINPESDIESIQQFLEEKDILFKTVKFIQTRRTDCKCAQITVDEKHAERVENPSTWPPGVSCRPWLRRTEYLKRYEQYDNDGDDEY